MRLLLERQQKRQAGFSLIEVLVSLSIFTIVVTIGVSTLYALIDANARARNFQEVMTNLSFTIDSMTREIRTGAEYYCSSDNSTLPVDGSAVRDCIDGASALAFNEGGRSLTGATPNNSRRIAYRLQDGAIQRRLGNGDGSGSVNDPEDWVTVTSEDVVVEEFNFYTYGTSPDDNQQPWVVVQVIGTVGEVGAARSEFRLQTTITQHLLDI